MPPLTGARIIARPSLPRYGVLLSPKVVRPCPIEKSNVHRWMVSRTHATFSSVDTSDLSVDSSLLSVDIS